MRILLAIDGSDVSRTAVEQLLARPWPDGSEVLVLSVVESLEYPAVPELALEEDDGAIARQALHEADDLVNGSAPPLRVIGLSVETRVAQGDPATEIVAATKRWRADLVVVGSHGRSGTQRFILGSVADYVVRHAPCSVEVARSVASRR